MSHCWPLPRYRRTSAFTSAGFGFARSASSAEDFERWRPRVAVWLLFAGALVLSYWTAWFADRPLVASADGAGYIDFEQSFPLADLWLMTALVLGAAALWRRRPSAIVWLAVAGGAGFFLCGLDVLYDLEHGIYAAAGGGWIELGINLITGISAAGVILFAWQHREYLLGEVRQ